MSAHLPLTRMAYKAQQSALRVSLVAAHLGLRPLLPARERPSDQDIQLLKARLDRLIERDVENVEARRYPEELLLSLPVREYLSGLPHLAIEVARMALRARSGKVRDLPRSVDLSRYPEYFRRNFHWQTDGYLSQRSAELYDLAVEFLFFGTADIMRRQVIAPLAPLLAQAQPKQVLDVACGTGRLLHQLSLAYPAHAYMGLDLSPFYLERARRLLADRGVTLCGANAEALPFSDATFDALTSVFLFHELPRRARQNVLREMRRVAKPGALLCIEDSAQLSDAPGLRVFLENFGHEMNEPFFLEYLDWDLEGELEAAGFRVEGASEAFLAKVVVASAS